MILSFLFALQALQSPLALRADTLRPRHDALHHEISIVVGDTGNHIVGLVQTTWLLRSADPVEVQLDSSFRVIRVLTDGEGDTRMGRITFALNPGGGVYIPHHKQAGDTLRTSIRYHGPVRDGLIIRTDSLGRRTVFADNWPDRAHHWLPLEDHPSDKATVSLHLEVPAGMQVVANGVLQKVDTLPRGRTVWHFDMRQRISPYGIVMGGGRLATTALPDAACEVKCVPLGVVTFPEDSGWAVGGPFRRAGDMLDFFSGMVGPFPYDRLSHVESTTIFGGMENPTAIFYDAKAYAGRRMSEETVAHETAHQWFGDAVTEDDWHHLWLSEGFATYFAALWIRHADGDSAFRATMARNRATVIASKETARPILDSSATDLMGLLNSNNYPKGAWVLHSLRGVIGDSAFTVGIRDWYRTYRDSTALSLDFARVMSRAAGEDLEWYFTQALTQPGYPMLDVHWRRHRNGLILTIREVQAEAWGSYRIPGLIIAIDGVAHSVNVTGQETVVTLPNVKRAPKAITVDPGGWWLLDAKVSGEP
jgi:aminopeptidase N